jgi:hypothetical protein
MYLFFHVPVWHGDHKITFEFSQIDLDYGQLQEAPHNSLH